MRDSQDPIAAQAWTLPPRPEIIPVSMPCGDIVNHVVGPHGLRTANVVDALRNIADRAANVIEAEQALGADCANKSTALHVAAGRGDVGVVFMLLQAKATLVHAKDEQNDTPLHYAAKNGHMAAASLLFDSGASCSAKNMQGQTPVDVATPALHTFLTDTMQVLAAFFLFTFSCLHAWLIVDLTSSRAA